jgi:aldose 1-epimerase
VLMPWPNRIADGAYEFDGRSHQLALTEPVRHNAIHGLVRWVRWSVGTRERHRVVMEHRLSPQPGYPFALHLGTEYALSSHGLTVTTTATNVGSSACPFGSGAHPYLTVGTQSVDDVLLRTPAATVLSVDDRGIPNGASSVTGTPYDFRRETAIGALRLDHAFTDLERDDDGLARVGLRPQGGAGGVVLWVDRSYRHLMLFTGDAIPEIGRRSLAVEPMTCPPNAFRTGEDVIRLEPGDSFSGTWGIAPRLHR